MALQVGGLGADVDERALGLHLLRQHRRRQQPPQVQPVSLPLAERQPCAMQVLPSSYVNAQLAAARISTAGPAVGDASPAQAQSSQMRSPVPRRQQPPQAQPVLLPLAECQPCAMQLPWISEPLPRRQQPVQG